MRKTVFLDRDGTINVEKNYLVNPDEFEFIDGSAQAIKLLKDNGFQVIVVTNQAGVARGYYSEEKVKELHNYINGLLKNYATSIDAFYYCPHHPVAGIGYYKRICKCRKPGTLMFENAMKDFDVDKESSYMVGDNISDIQAGNNFGVQTILVGTGYGTKVKEDGSVKYNHFSNNLLEAANYIVSNKISRIENSENVGDTMVEEELDLLCSRYNQLTVCRQSIYSAYNIIKTSYENNGKLLVAGNGGSAADAEHIVGELMKGFVRKRPIDDVLAKKLCEIDNEYGEKLKDNLQVALPAIALTAQEAVSTAFLNDVDGSMLFAQLVNGYGNINDVFLGISTSGNSKNVVMAAITAKAKGMKVVALTGKNDSILEKYADVTIKVPATETYQIQELHLPVYHALCLMLEKTFFSL